jgi:hypothetical protein
MKGRILVAALLGGIVMFFWGYVSHVVLELGDHGIKAAPAPPGDEPLMQALQAVTPDDGLYLAPGGDWEHRADPKVKEEWDKRWNAGPRALIVVNHAASRGMTKQLVTEFATDVLLALLAAILLSCAAAHCGFMGRTLFVTGLGVVACFRTIQDWNWWEFPCVYASSKVVDALIGFTLMGIVIALVVKRPARS